MVSMLFMVGRMALSKASLTICFVAAKGVAPSIREFSIISRLSAISPQSLLAPSAMPVIQLPTTMPEMGMKYWGLKDVYKRQYEGNPHRKHFTPFRRKQHETFINWLKYLGLSLIHI